MSKQLIKIVLLICSLFLLNPSGIKADTQNINFGGSTPNALNEESVAGAESADFSCRGASVIAIKTEYSRNDTQANLRLIYKDHNIDVGRIYLPIFTPANTKQNNDIQESGFFHGVTSFFRTQRCNTYKIQLVDSPIHTGTVSVWTAAISQLANITEPPRISIVREEEQISSRTVTGINDDGHVSLRAQAIDETTGFVLIDLSDSTNFPHTNIDHVLITWLSVSINPSTAFRGDVCIGFLSGVGTSNSDLNILQEYHMDQAASNINQFNEYNSSHYSSSSSNSLLDFVEDTGIFTTGGDLARPGNSTTAPQNGDIAILVTRSQQGQ